jgi:hypothetical protein
MRTYDDTFSGQKIYPGKVGLSFNQYIVAGHTIDCRRCKREPDQFELMKIHLERATCAGQRNIGMAIVDMEAVISNA